MRLRLVSGISSGFPGLFQSLGQVTHVLLTRSPLITQEQALEVTVRLACVKHAASVRPEPGSNSPLMFDSRRTEKSDYRRTDRSFTLGGLFHWLSTNNQLSLLFVVNQRIFVRLHSPAWWPVRLDATRYYLASIFDTLLSSQGSDAHQRFAHRARRRGWYPCCSPCGGATVLTYPRPCLGVKSVIRCVSGRTGSRLDLCGAPTLAPWGAGSNSVSVATGVALGPGLGVGSARGTGLLGAGWRPIRLASVPPSRADVENIR